MTLNPVIFLILRFSPNSTDLQDDYITVVEDRPIISVKYCLPVLWPTSNIMFRSVPSATYEGCKITQGAQRIRSSLAMCTIQRETANKVINIVIAFIRYAGFYRAA